MDLNHILFVDDNRDFVLLGCSVLEQYGYQMTAAYSGQDAILKATALHPDLIICDIVLPDLDGYFVANTVRNNKDIEDCFLISLSGYTQTDDPDASRAAGFDMHMAKPVDIRELLKTLEFIKQI